MHLAPGLTVSPGELNQVRHHAVLAHGLAVQAIRANGKSGTKVGPAENIETAVPLIEAPEHIEAAKAATRERNAPFLTVMLEGKYTDAYLEENGKDAPKFTDEDLKSIIDIELAKVSKRLAEKGLKLILTEEAKKFLIEKGSNKEYGARPLRRAIEQNLEDPLSEDLLRGAFSGMEAIRVVVQGEDKDQKLVFEAVANEQRPSSEMIAPRSSSVAGRPSMK